MQNIFFLKSVFEVEHFIKFSVVNMIYQLNNVFYYPRHYQMCDKPFFVEAIKYYMTVLSYDNCFIVIA